MKRLIVKAIKIFVISLALLFVKFLPLHASHLQFISFDDFVSKSDSIVIGKVIETWSDYDEDGKFIYTYARFKVAKDIKKTLDSDEILIRYLGGQVGNRQMTVEGGVNFTSGERALLFLNANNEVYSVMGLSLGKLRVIKDAFSGLDMATAPMSNEIHQYDDHLAKVNGQNVFNQKIFLDGFVDKIKEKLNN